MSDTVPGPAPMEPQQLRALLQEGRVVIVDVRSAEEFATGAIDGALHIPIAELEGRAGEIPKDVQVVTVCARGGGRSCAAADQLQALGHDTTVPLRGGMQAWQE